MAFSIFVIVCEELPIACNRARTSSGSNKKKMHKLIFLPWAKKRSEKKIAPTF